MARAKPKSKSARRAAKRPVKSRPASNPSKKSKQLPSHKRDLVVVAFVVITMIIFFMIVFGKYSGAASFGLPAP